jgi:hypothetical protein
METVTKNAEYRTLGKRVIREHEDLSFITETGIRISFLSSDFEETASGGRYVYGECRKVPAWVKAFIPYDFVIIFY